MSGKRIEYHQGAATDVKNAFNWYRKRSREAASNFLVELDQAAETIRKAPERWPVGMNNTRRFQLWRFPFSIIYSGARIGNHSLGGRSRQQAAGVLGASSNPGYGFQLSLF